MTGWQIHLLGAPGGTYRGRPLPPFPTQRSRDLFYYLVLKRGVRQCRDVLIAEFCEECPDRVARKRFRTVLWRMRSTVGSCADPEGFRLETARGEVSLHLGPECWIDVERFEALMRRADAPGLSEDESAACLDQAIDLYRGDLLEGVYHEWCAQAQRALKARLLQALDRRMEHAARRRDWPVAIEFARRLLVHDPLQEHVHRALMAFLYRNGDRPKAIQQYRSLEAQLDAELCVRPMAETRTLYDAIRNDALPSHRPAPA